MSSLREHIERAERLVKPVPSIAAEISRLAWAAAAEHDRLRERALESLERDFGISRDRVTERGDLEVTPDEFARLRSTSVQIAGREEPYSTLTFEIRVIVVKPEPVCDRTERCEATEEHFLSCEAAPWRVGLS